ncbi:MAG: preprotein translocase subunit SecG [Omnitrophica WOR_2 bacterium GWF2_38_59]|nr:MAG: preprotein translocase subunit SecG [Omnitrophica WOR_2 bacterium GWF2_38_59]OGX46845.1 MAG: preprotein translocase subunit SecG [Omnitrophica WOR_2 bacterium RIFOXYA2_FULL_38_17]OGX56994.1 MAG: preprotein translocase subunit SecG [Omnitrophica WOR_2 bacterium RIFOXYB2_FULL_38_16]OGX59530.1 MAG: preprotein translocase subunit SecG [Omnitrophica WOR_2 bacterium RIFOXYC2_FULL_38_12]HBG61535.1 preprotein translocase subunit SecG [Candidatus Omnitrophota bacterium]
MEGLMFFVHVITCVLIIAVILMQSGRGGGLTEGFASAESMFGAQTNEFMIKATTVLAGVFLVTSLTLAVLSAKKEVSVMAKRNAQNLADKTVKTIANTQE